MKNNLEKDNNLFEKKSAETFYRSLRLLENVMVLVVISALGLLIFNANQKSILNSLKPRPDLIESTSYNENAAKELDLDRVVKGIHVETGMIYDVNFSLVRGACTSCHSSKLVIQNRATRDGWKQMINWMQETQGLQDLGKYEVKILDYLEKNYAPEESGRRKNLIVAEEDWYYLDEG